MNIAVNWDNEEQTVIRWDFSGKWDWDDFWQAKLVSDQMISSKVYVVNLIGNLQDSRLLPANAFSNYRSTTRSTPPNAGHVVLVRVSPFVRTMVNTFNRLHMVSGPGSIVGMVDNLDDARALLAAEHPRDNR